MSISSKPSWFLLATFAERSPEDYWYTVEGQISQSRFQNNLHHIECQLGNYSQPLFPDLAELTKIGVDLEILARQLYDGINAELFGKALAAEGSASRINTVLKAGTVADVNGWMERIIARSARAAAAAATTATAAVK